MPPSTAQRIDALRALAHELGFDHCSLAPAAVEAVDRDAYLRWCDDGFAAGMTYMTRDPNARVDPRTVFNGARSVLTVAVSYHQGALPPKPGPGWGRVARYAWGRDYHDLILARLERLLSRLPEVLGPAAGRAAVDTRPLLERAHARRSGLGFTGKNTVTILPRGGSGLRFHVGSYVFLGEILLDVESAEPGERPADGCGACRRCLDACPTAAFEGPYRLNAGRCISYLTIENKGWIPRELRAGVGDWVFGCDICQDVCPFNARAFETRWPELRADQGVGAWLSLETLLSLNDNDFKHRFRETPLSRPKRRGLVRNACVAAGNCGDESLSPALDALCADPEPMVRGHALGALDRLSPQRARVLADRLRADPDPAVRSEAGSVLDGGS